MSWLDSRVYERQRHTGVSPEEHHQGSQGAGAQDVHERLRNMGMWRREGSEETILLLFSNGRVQRRWSETLLRGVWWQEETTGKTLSIGSVSHHEWGWHGHRYPEDIWNLSPQKWSELAWIWLWQPAATGRALSRRLDCVASGGPAQAKFFCDCINIQLKAKWIYFHLLF